MFILRLIIRPNKKNVFKVTQPCLSLLVKPRVFFQVFWKKYNFMHFERQMPFKMHKIIFFS